jgi:hypothetical protein
MTATGVIQLTTVRLLAFTLLIAATAGAQDQVPKKLSTGTGDGGTTADGGSSVAAVSTAPLPEAPVPHRVIDKKFIFVMGGLGAAETMRFTSRKLVLDNEFAAGAPWVTHVPTNQHLVAEYAGFYAAELLVVYEIKKPHSWLPGDKVIRKLWWVYPAVMGTIHVKNGIGNIRTKGPGGCTSMECAEQMQ